MAGLQESLGGGGPAPVGRTKGSPAPGFWRELVRELGSNFRDPMGPGPRTEILTNAIMDMNPEVYGVTGDQGLRTSFGNRDMSGVVARHRAQREEERLRSLPPPVRPAGLPRPEVRVRGGFDPLPEDNPELIRAGANALAGPGLRELLSGVAPGPGLGVGR